MPDFYPTPTASPFTDIAQYVGLLLGAIDSNLDTPSAWDEGEYESVARGYIQDLIAYIMGLPDMANFPPGAIMAYGSLTPPAGWLVCDGTLYDNADYPDLHAAIGANFGSDGSGIRFRVPNLAGRAAVGVGGSFGAIGFAAGEDYVTLEESNIPYHQHEYTEWVNTTMVLESADPAAVAVINDSGRDVNLTASFGGSGLHENRQPSLAIQYIIKT